MAINSSQLKTTWRGAYNNSTTYNTNDMVLYSGSAWIYRNATSASGNAPGSSSLDSTAYWYRVTKGSDLGALTLAAGSLIKHDGTNFVSQPIGTAGQILKVNSGTNQLELEAQQANTDINFKVRKGNAYISGIVIDATNEKVGVFTDNPTVEFDVTGAGKFSGNVTVGGNLLVSGDTTFLDTTTLRVEDKNIQLGLQGDSTEGNDAAIDGGGITLTSSQGSKDIIWLDATNSWTFNQNINLITNEINSDPSYRIDGTTVLSKTELASTVTTATGLVNIGTLGSLNIDNLGFDGSTITITGGGLNIVSSGDIAVNTQKITGVTDPTAAQGVATKNYVDITIDAENVGLSLDITGFSNPNAGGVGNGPINDVIAVLQTLYPANTKNGAIATIHCTNYAGASINISQGLLSGALNKSYIAVDKDNVSSSTSVMQDLAVAAGGVSGSATITPTRYTMTFTSNGTSWSHGSTSNYP